MSETIVTRHPSIETAHERKAAMPTTTKKTPHHASAETPATENTAVPAQRDPHHVTTTDQTNQTKQAKEDAAMPTSNLAVPVQTPVHPSVHSSLAAAPVAASVSPAKTVPPVSETHPAVAPPPTSANIPPTPAGFSPASPGEFRSVVPRQAELAAMPQALTDLAKFTDFDTLFGAIGLTQAAVTACLTMASDWSAMRGATTQWDLYCILQEGYAWRAARAALLRLEQAFALAAEMNPKLAASYPGLSSLLGVKKSIAQKAASTRRLNKAAKDNGEPQTHGVVGKKRQRRAEKAALANGAGASTPSGSPAAPTAPSAPVDTTPPASPAPANGASNGAAH
jgi:hypothetical protein